MKTYLEIEVYTFFGRALKRFPVKENETHHKASEKARAYGLSLGHNNWWVRDIFKDK